MQRWLVNLEGIEARSAVEKAAVGRALMRLVVLRNLAWLNRHPGAPDVYESGVRFRREPWAGSGLEEIAAIPTVLRRGWGDCDDLVAYRCASLIQQGVPAAPAVKWDPNERLFHAVVRLPDGSIEDPAQRLGMR